MKKALIVSSLSSLFLLAGCGSMEFLGSDADIVAAGTQNCQQLDAQNKITHRYDARMRNIRRGLPTTISGQTLDYKVYETEDMNAFALPNGCVRVYSALLDKLNDDEARAVIGHEIGHVALRHSVQQYRTNSGVAMTLQGVNAVGSLFGISDDSGMLNKLAFSAISAQYSQRLETEADDYSIDLLLKERDGHKKAMALADALRKISADGEDSTLLRKMFGSHPNTKERIAHIEKRVNTAP